MGQTHQSTLRRKPHRVTIKLRCISVKLRIKQNNCAVYMLYNDDKAKRIFTINGSNINTNDKFLRVGSRLHAALMHILWLYQSAREVKSGYYIAHQTHMRAILNVGYEIEYFDSFIRIMDSIPLVWTIKYNDLYAHPMNGLCKLYTDDIAYKPYAKQEDIVRTEIRAILVDYCAFPTDIANELLEYCCSYSIAKFDALSPWIFSIDLGLDLTRQTVWCTDFDAVTSSWIIMMDGTFRNTPIFSGCDFHFDQSCQ
eukprot:490087_1